MVDLRQESVSSNAVLCSTPKVIFLHPNDLAFKPVRIEIGISVAHRASDENDVPRARVRTILLHADGPIGKEPTIKSSTTNQPGNS
jgi:hypothetical protein